MLISYLNRFGTNIRRKFRKRGWDGGSAGVVEFALCARRNSMHAKVEEVLRTTSVEYGSTTA